MSVDSLRIYHLAADLADSIAREVIKWELFHQRTLGDQIVRAADSVSNNISEGYGRTSIGERLQFYMYAEGSVQETRNCLERAANRGLIDLEEHQRLRQICRLLSIGIVEFAHAQLQREPDYRGPFRERIAKRREWLVKRRGKD